MIYKSQNSLSLGLIHPWANELPIIWMNLLELFQNLSIVNNIMNQDYRIWLLAQINTGMGNDWEQKVVSFHLAYNEAFNEF